MSRTSCLSLTAPLLLLGACLEPDESQVPSEDHCVNQSGNAWCEARTQGMEPYCVRGIDDCVPEDADGCLSSPPPPSCYVPCGELTLAQDPYQTCPGFPEDDGGSTSSTTTGSSTSSTSTTASTSSSGSTTGDVTTSEETSTTGTGEESTTGPQGCISDQDCTSPQAPVCDLEAGTCTSCSAGSNPDAACEAADPLTPVCIEGDCVACSNDDVGSCTGATPVCLDNACVACTEADVSACPEETPACGPENTCVECTETDLAACEDTTPLCDAGTNACVGCTAHEQCPAGAPDIDGAACDLETGACLPAENVWHVDEDADDCSDLGEGTLEVPLCGLREAVGRAELAGTGTIILHEIAGGQTYSDEAISAPVRLAILAADGEEPRIEGNVLNPGLIFGGGAVAYLRGLSIVEGDSHGIDIDVARVHAEGVLIQDNAGWGVSVAPTGAFFASNSRIVTNEEGGIEFGTAGPVEETDGEDGSGSGTDGMGLPDPDSASVRLVNCFVNAATDAHAVVVNEGAIDVLYSTLGVPATLDAFALRCETGTFARVRNSVLVSRLSEPVDCDNVELETSFVEQDVDADDWFEDYNAGEFTLNGPPEELLEGAQWRTGDPATDIDGRPRPAADGAVDAAGAARPTD